MIRIVGRIGYVVVILLALVGITSIVARFVGTVQFLADPSAVDVTANAPPGAEGFDERYYAHPYLTLVHILVGFLFMVLGPIQFWPAVRNRWIRYHRWAGRVWMIAALVGVTSALLFVPVLPVFGSFSTRVAVVFASLMFLVCLAQGYRRIRHRQIAQHREWMIRTFAIGLGISTFRVMIPFLMMPPLNATFPEAWDTVVWLAFAVNVIVAEAWINVTRRQPQPVPRTAPIREHVLQTTRAVRSFSIRPSRASGEGD
ncbi:MAG: DUF2306 domain-containing protein [Pirellulales bacterium]